MLTKKIIGAAYLVDWQMRDERLGVARLDRVRQLNARCECLPRVFDAFYPPVVLQKTKKKKKKKY